MGQSEVRAGSIVELVDDDNGEVIQFGVLAIILLDGQEYILLTPADVPKDPESVDVSVFARVRNDDGTVDYFTVDDDIIARVQVAAELHFENLRKESGGSVDLDLN